MAYIWFLARHPEIAVGLSPPSFWIFELLFIVIGTEILAIWMVQLLPNVIRVRVCPAQVPLHVPVRRISTLPGLRGVLAGARNAFGRIDWEIVLKDATVLSQFALVISGALLVSVISKHPETMTSFAALSPLVIGGGLLCVLIAFIASPTLLAHPARIVSASVFLAVLFAFLLMQPLLYAGAAALQPIWQTALSYFAGYLFGGASFVSTMLLLAALYASAPVETGPVPQRLLLAFAALFATYLVVYFVFTKLLHQRRVFSSRFAVDGLPQRSVSGAWAGGDHRMRPQLLRQP